MEKTKLDFCFFKITGHLKVYKQKSHKHVKIQRSDAWASKKTEITTVNQKRNEHKNGVIRKLMIEIYPTSTTQS